MVNKLLTNCLKLLQEVVMQKKEILIFESDNESTTVNVYLENDTLWLSLNQMAELFDRHKSVIARHLNNIFTEGELSKNSTVANFATVQLEGDRSIKRDIECFNLDAIISVGYRVNSKKGTQFRKWATKVLNDHLLKGYSLNQVQLNKDKILELKQTIELLSNTLINQGLVEDTGVDILNLIKEYSKTWEILLKYDENRLEQLNKSEGEKLASLSYSDTKTAIELLKNELIVRGAASTLFGFERDKALESILNNITQTFDRMPLYGTNKERAAHLLYFIIKDHPFSDGNKRIGSFLFLKFLREAHLNPNLMSNNSLIALALLVAESQPNQKDLLIRLIINLLSD
jgi:prophage maintenance system killer protein